jgi:hypothetical protein
MLPLEFGSLSSYSIIHLDMMAFRFNADLDGDRMARR